MQIHIYHPPFESCRESGLIIALEEPQPLGDMLSAVGSWFLRDAEITAEEGSTKFGDERFGGGALVVLSGIEPIALQTTCAAAMNITH